MTVTPKVSVLFVCVKNGGKSQMAAGLLRHLLTDQPTDQPTVQPTAGIDLAVEVGSAGTKAGSKLNELSVQVLAENGIDITDQQPRQLTAELQQQADWVITLGADADVEPVPGPHYETWDIDEPSLRGIDGEERMRLVRDDIARHVQDLHTRLTTHAEPKGGPVMTPITVGSDHDYTSLIDDLTYRFDGIHNRATVSAAVEQARSRLEATATVPDFLPVLVARFAREQLTATAQADGRLTTTMPELLFVCIHNAGRSQLAAALARQLSNGKVHVRSAGSDPTGEINPLVVQVLAERGIDLTDAYPKPLTNDVVRAADVIVTMGCGDTCPVFPGRRYLDWDIPDPNGADLDTVRDIRDQIQAQVTALLRDLNI